MASVFVRVFSGQQRWRFRPADARYWSLESLADDVAAFEAALKVERAVALSEVRCAALSNEILLTFNGDRLGRCTALAFEQLCDLLGAPAGWLRSLGATLVAQNLNHALAARRGSGEVLLVSRLDLPPAAPADDPTRLVVSLAAAEAALREPRASLGATLAWIRGAVRSGLELADPRPAPAGAAIACEWHGVAPTALWLGDRGLTAYLTKDGRPWLVVRGGGPGSGVYRADGDACSWWAVSPDRLCPVESWHQIESEIVGLQPLRQQPFTPSSWHRSGFDAFCERLPFELSTDEVSRAIAFCGDLETDRHYDLARALACDAWLAPHADRRLALEQVAWRELRS
jgi:hypothetical protein